MLSEKIAISFSELILKKIIGKGFDSIYNELTSNDKIDFKFKKAIEVVSKELQGKYPVILGGAIEYFFKKEENFYELLKLLFINAKVDEKTIEKNFDIRTLPKDFIIEFITNLKTELNKDLEINKILSNKELFLNYRGIFENINSIKSTTNLSIVEIRKIRKILEKNAEKSFSYSEFKTIYFKNAINNLSQVNFFGLGLDLSIKKSRQKLKNIYVKPNFISNKEQKNRYDLHLQRIYKTGDFFQPEHIIKYSDLFELNKNLVILGTPGSGKSILIKSIICSIIEKKTREFKNNEILDYLPFRIELRKYLLYKKKNTSNLLNYLSILLSTEYSLYNMITEKILCNLLSKKKVILFFDGLDEIFNANEKNEVKNDIENFHNQYKNLRSITTSRIIGYDEAKLQKENFIELQILNFDDEQIEEYVRKWYKQEESNNEIREAEISQFLSEINYLDEELVENPLLLSLIVILYRNNLKMPESKLDIYQSCTKTLVDKWDSQKNLKIDLDKEIYKRKDIIFSDLAFWQYKQLSGSNTNISYSRVKKEVENSLVNRLKIANEYNSGDLAEKFLNYAQKRSIYFENSFTHKTFLEYYTAYWIYSNFEKKHKIDERNSLILKYIDNSSWFIVLELLVNLIDKDQADTEIIDSLFKYQIQKKPSSFAFILKAITSITNISVNLIEEILINSIIHSIKKRNKKLDKNNFSYTKKSYLLSKDIFEGVKNLLINKKYFNIFKEANFKIESQLEENELKLFYIFFLELTFKVTIFEKRNNLEKFLKIQNKFKKFNKFLNNDPYIYYLNFIIGQENHNVIEATKLLVKLKNLFTIDKLFINYRGYFFNISFISPFSIFINHFHKPENLENLSKYIEILLKNKISKSTIIYNIFRNVKYYFFPRPPKNLDFARTIQKIVLKSEDNELKGIAYSLFYIVFSRKGNATSISIENFIKELPTKEKAFLKTFLRKTNRNTAYTLLGNYLKIKLPSLKE